MDQCYRSYAAVTCERRNLKALATSPQNFTSRCFNRPSRPSKRGLQVTCVSIAEIKIENNKIPPQQLPGGPAFSFLHIPVATNHLPLRLRCCRRHLICCRIHTIVSLLVFPTWITPESKVHCSPVDLVNVCSMQYPHRLKECVQRQIFP